DGARCEHHGDEERPSSHAASPFTSLKRFIVMSIGRLVYYATEERRGAPLRASVVMSQARRPGGRLPVTRVAPWFDHAHALWQDRAATADAPSVLYQRRRTRMSPTIARDDDDSRRGAAMPRTDTDVIFDPSTYVEGVPFDALTRLRRASPVVWVEEGPVLGWPGGPGFWLVLRHADVETVLTQPQLFSSAIGGTQIRDPTTPEALRYVRRMMLNMDPPEHSRLRRLLTKSFTPRPVAQLEERIRGHARAIVARVVADAESGQCDFPKGVAADLPLSTLAEVLGMPAADLVEPGHRLPGPRLRLVRRVRPGIRHDDGPRGPPAASFARPRRLDARSAHAGGNARPLRLRAPP